jgi:hypothetical protein
MQVLQHHRKDMIAAQAQWLGYCSSTSVYGDWQGGWVDEACASAFVGPSPHQACMRERRV